MVVGARCACGGLGGEASLIEARRAPLSWLSYGLSLHHLDETFIIDILSIKSQLVECNLIQATDTIQRNPLTTPPLTSESRRGLKTTIALFKIEDRNQHPPTCSCGGLSGARCLDCMASLIESDVSRGCHVRVLLIFSLL